MSSRPSHQLPDQQQIAPDPTHIAFGVDRNYYRGMGVNIVSVLTNNPALKFIFHVFAFVVPPDERQRLLDLERQYETTIVIHQLETSVLSEFKQFPCFADHPLGTFVRLLIPDLLQGITDKVLYLDADVLCFGKIDELLAVDLEQYIAAVVIDEASTTVATQVVALALPRPEYFNAGIMYINVEAWVRQGIQKQALTTLSSRQMRFADQDALNLLLNGQTIYVDKKWNFRYHLLDFLMRAEIKFDIREPYVFVHFTGPAKPWQNWCLHDARDVFVNYQNKSPWSSVTLDVPTSVKELKLYSRILKKHGQIMQSIAWHAKYLFARIKRDLQGSKK